MRRRSRASRPPKKRARSSGDAVRVPFRIAGGPSIGLLAPIGFSLGGRIGIQASPAALIERGVALGGGSICATANPCAVAGADLSLVVLPLDTFFLRVGGGARRVAQEFETGSVRRDTDGGVIVGIGNRWDVKDGMVSVEWLGVYLPVIGISTQQPPTEAPRPIEVRVVTVTWGFGVLFAPTRRVAFAPEKP